MFSLSSQVQLFVPSFSVAVLVMSTLLKIGFGLTDSNVPSMSSKLLPKKLIELLPRINYAKSLFLGYKNRSRVNINELLVLHFP